MEISGLRTPEVDWHRPLEIRTTMHSSITNQQCSRSIIDSEATVMEGGSQTTIRLPLTRLICIPQKPTKCSLYKTKLCAGGPLAPHWTMIFLHQEANPFCLNICLTQLPQAMDKRNVCCYFSRRRSLVICRSFIINDPSPDSPWSHIWKRSTLNPLYLSSILMPPPLKMAGEVYSVTHVRLQ